MAKPVRIEPDVEFKQQLIGAGGETLTKCYQCGTCTVACPLSPDTQPFPRKEILWAQWGLKDRLMADPDVWLCHQCNDCAQLCPRGASPGDVLAVVRQSVVERYSAPSALARLVAKPSGLTVLFAIPAILMVLFIAVTGGFSAGEGHGHILAGGIFAPEGGFKSPADFDHFFAHYPIIIFFTGFVGLAMLGALAGLVRYWKAMANGPLGTTSPKNPSLVGCAIAVVKDILTHKKFTECEATATRYWGHLLLFYGFGAMFVTTALAAILYYVPNDWGTLAAYPFVWWHPVKLLGNIGGIVFLVGLVLVIRERLKDTKLTPQSTYADWLFIVVIGLTVVTGITCQAARLADVAAVAYATYFVHLLFVFFLLVYMPYSKFAHLLYRTVAMMYSHYSGREDEVAVAVSEKGPEPETPEQNAA